jgi:hypothetical protein
MYFASLYRWQLYFFAAILSHRRESTIFAPAETAKFSPALGCRLLGSKVLGD